MDAAGITRVLLPGDAVDDLATRCFNAAGRGAGDELEFFFAGVDFSGRQLRERLAEDAAALDDFEGADKEAGADVAGLLDGDVEVKFGIGSVGRGAAQVLAQS